MTGLAGNSVAVTGDLSEPAVVDQVVSTAVETFGGLDVLVNNAGVMDGMTATADVTDAEWERVIRINLTAPFQLTRAALPHMLARGRGAIVNTASEAGLRGAAAGTAYTVSKHGIVGLTKSLAIMYRDAGIPHQRHRAGRDRHQHPGWHPGRSRRRDTPPVPGQRRPGLEPRRAGRRDRVPRLGRRQQHQRRRAGGGQRLVGRLDHSME